MDHSSRALAPPLAPSAAGRAPGGSTEGTPRELPRVPGLTVTGMLRRWMLGAKRRGLPKSAATRLIRWMEQQADAIWGPA